MKILLVKEEGIKEMRGTMIKKKKKDKENEHVLIYRSSLIFSFINQTISF